MASADPMSPAIRFQQLRRRYCYRFRSADEARFAVTFHWFVASATWPRLHVVYVSREPFARSRNPRF